MRYAFRGGLAAVVLLLWVSTAHGEALAPSVHWGAIAYPDRTSWLAAGLTLNRFTQFNEDGKPFSSRIGESAGFNFATVSWSERFERLPGWSSNLSFGAGPTYREPTESLQNGLVHHLAGENPVPVGQRREETDFMASGALTRWLPLLGQQEAVFAGLGVATGTLYHEAYLRAGIRRLSMSELLEPVVGRHAFMESVSRYVRLSAMARYGRIWGGSAYGSNQTADHSYLGQASLSFGDYSGGEPGWELEFSATFDSGLFVDSRGHSLQRWFGSIALRFPYGVVETWNDVVGATDDGPTFGLQVMVDLRRVYHAIVKP
ncbi:hypothetical protein YTPLAS18_31210 [Nitrospira sp.]|nr:hypothetical protein YTPLAS18_31210 [Nitrospira sp.]